jgi:TrmH family RNA methyltransferase
VSPFAHPLRVVLVSPRNPLNIGAAARAMSNFGFQEMRLVNAYDVAFREAKSAVKSQYVLEQAREFPSVEAAVADCGLIVGTTALGPRAMEHRIRRLEYGGRAIRKQLASTPVALLFGSEKFGLSVEDMSYCHWLVRIPSREEHGSMNLGQAVAICLYELIRSSTAAAEKPEPQRPALAADVDRLNKMLEEALVKAGYVHTRTEGSTELKLRRLIRRMDLNAHDVQVWLGIARQLLWKLGQGS